MKTSRSSYIIGMVKFVLALTTAVVLSSLPVLADKTDEAIEIVSCINTANGHSEPVYGTPWELSQAVLELPFEHELERLADGYFFIGGRRLGYHGTWAAFLDLSLCDGIAYEVRDQDDALLIFASSFVPPEVVSALGGCGVVWGGFWIEEYPIVVLDPPPVTPLPEGQRLPNNSLESGVDLLPPKRTSE
ncbi:hypothetical protein [Ruegeria atlantica]|uniref:Uncharacterized protein n=1 Tax=Ruegeria atlantica TaxID=81569 RepID=A0A0N7LNR4_9RHOB|nr:hypothetical protein [Ruegeria atlantica]CUH43148.1 hypothetical protein RUM4293_02041 [Ruegeria atlantica]